MAKLVTIFGGSGFLGRYIAQRMAKRGWRVRVACRRPNEALFLKTYGVVGQVAPIFCNIRDDDSVREALVSSDAVINCVGILVESGRNGFEAVQSEGAGRIARIAREEGVERLVQISAIGADPESESDYARSKAAGEAAVQEAFPGAVILRPSIMFGSEDEFFNRFATMASRGPVLPLVGADTRFQPVYVDDVAAAAETAVVGGVAPGIYELGGPDVATFRELMSKMLEIVQRRRLVLGMPFWLGRLMGGVFDGLQKLSLGLFTNKVLTRDQVLNLPTDNVVADSAIGFEAFGITPTPMGSVLPGYLWTYRPSGQYAAIKNSAKNLHVSNE